MHTKTPNNPQTQKKTPSTVPKKDGAANKQDINRPPNLKNKNNSPSKKQKKNLLI